MLTHWRDSFPKLAVVPISITVVLAAYTGMRFRHWNFDDAFIVYRYVANLRAGHGWAFNLGEDWNASTSVLNPLLILLTSLVVRNIPTSAHVVGLAALGIGTASMSVALLRQGHHLPAVVLPAVALLLPPLLLSWGLETQLFLGLILCLLALEQRGRNTWLLSGLLVLVRPDGALFLVFKTARDIWARRAIPWRGLATAGAVVAPWAVYSLLRFGTLLPGTLANKRGQGASGQWGTGRVYIAGFRDAFLPIFIQPGVLFTIILLAIVGVVAIAMRHQWWLELLALFALAQQLAYVVFDPPYYHWYGIVFLFALCLFALLGADALLRALPPRLGLPSSLALLAIIFSGMARHWLPDDAETAPRPREIAYQQVARYIRSQHPHARAISVTEAGLISFSIPLRMHVVDLLGLTSDNPPYYKGTDLSAFFADPPDLALFHAAGPGKVWGFETPIFQDARFGARYELEHTFKLAGYPDLWLYHLRAPGAPETPN
jgi:arabinofuranosyltransferase